MSIDLYGAALRSDARAIVEAAKLHADLPAPAVPSCPGWRVGDLVFHLGGVHRRIAQLVRNREREPIRFGQEDLAFMAMDPCILAWFAGGRAPTGEPLPSGLVDWFAQGATHLQGVLDAVDPREPVWTWSTEQRAGFWESSVFVLSRGHRALLRPS